MGIVIFIVGFLCGGCFGVILTGLMAAGSDDAELKDAFMGSDEE